MHSLGLARQIRPFLASYAHPAFFRVRSFPGRVHFSACFFLLPRLRVSPAVSAVIRYHRGPSPARRRLSVSVHRRQPGQLGTVGTVSARLSPALFLAGLGRVTSVDYDTRQNSSFFGRFLAASAASPAAVRPWQLFGRPSLASAAVIGERRPRRCERRIIPIKYTKFCTHFEKCIK